MLSAAELLSMSATIAASFDQSLPQYRKTANTTDGYGTAAPTWTFQANVACTVAKPSASKLVAYAALIGSQRAITIRVLHTVDVREGDRLVYDSLNWLVQAEMEQSSYTVTKQFLMTVIV